LRAPVSFVAIQPWAAGTSPAITTSRDEVHVWRASLNQLQEHLVRLMRILSPQERARAERFHFEVDRKRCILARALLRLLLGRSLGTFPHLVRFRHNDFGKPRLAPALHPLVQFNLSHSGDLVLIALGRGRALGVDVEQIRMDVATENIAVRFFSDNERRGLASVPPVLQREAFFACWTRKEAYVKARGDGLSLRLEQFDVSFLKKRSRVSLKLGMILPKWTAGPCAH
jgi:4'-phosphopantetheinyl transferase